MESTGSSSANFSILETGSDFSESSVIRNRKKRLEKIDDEKDERIENLETKSRVLIVVIVLLSLFLALSVIILFVLAFLVIRSQISEPQITESYDTLILDSRIDLLGYIEDEKTVYIDVRTKGEFSRGSVEGAILIPYDEIYEGHPELPEDFDTPIIVFCRTGRRSGTAKKTLIKIGYTKVVNGGSVADVKRSMKKDSDE